MKRVSSGLFRKNKAQKEVAAKVSAAASAASLLGVEEDNTTAATTTTAHVAEVASMPSSPPADDGKKPVVSSLKQPSSMKHQSILPDSPDRDSNNKSHDNEPLMVFENKEEDEEGEEDTTILNMSLLRNLLGPSTTNLIEDANKHMGDDSDAGMMPPKNVSFSGVESVEGSLKEDDDKTHEELIQKIGKVKAKLTQLGIDKSAERAMRKKKDKSLVKLAKELNKRAADQQKKEKTIAKYKGAVADLEAKLSATRSEMDERIATNEKKTTDYNAALDAAHKRYRTCVADHDLKVSDLTKAHNLDSETVRRGEKEASLEGERLRTQLATARELAVHKKADDELRVEEQKLALSEVQQQKRDTALEHEGRITEMIRKHEEQTDDLRRQLLEANLECDKIRTELASHQMQASPDEAGDIITRTLRSASFRKQKKTFTKKIMPCLQMATIVLVVLSAIAYQYGLLSMNAICAPVMPGTTLQDDADHMWEAPWWVPAGTMKESVFSTVCRDRPRSSVKFATGRLVVTDLATDKVILYKTSDITVVHANIINFFDRKGKIDSLRSPWSN